MTQDCNQKVQKPFATYLYTHLTLSPFDMMMMGKSFLGNLNLLHARGITLEDAKNLVLFQMNKVWMVSAAEGTAEFEEKLGIYKYCKLSTGVFACI